MQCYDVIVARVMGHNPEISWSKLENRPQISIRCINLLLKAQLIIWVYIAQVGAKQNFQAGERHPQTPFRTLYWQGTPWVAAEQRPGLKVFQIPRYLSR